MCVKLLTQILLLSAPIPAPCQILELIVAPQSEGLPIPGLSTQIKIFWAKIACMTTQGRSYGPILDYSLFYQVTIPWVPF